MSAKRLAVFFIGMGCAFGEPEKRAGGMVARFDQDGDGKLSRAEFDQMRRVQRLDDEKRARLFARFDKNGDGFIDASEQPQQTRRPGWMAWDSDADGVVTRDEMQRAIEGKGERALKRAEKVFAKMDRNKDGQIDKADRPKRQSKDPLAMLVQMDTDGDGQVTREEWEASDRIKRLPEKRRRAVFAKLDRNKDGVLSEADSPRRKKPAKSEN